MFRTRVVARFAVALTTLITGAVPALAAEGGWTASSVSAYPPAATSVVLNGVDVRTDSDAWAVGTAFGPAGTTPGLPTYRWTGSGWNLVPTPALADPGALTSVSASSATDAWAVGFTGRSY